jgi:hypothetical protein
MVVTPSDQPDSFSGLRLAFCVMPQTASSGDPCGGRRGAFAQSSIIERTSREQRSHASNRKTVQTECEGFRHLMKIQRGEYRPAADQLQVVS